MKLPSSLFYYYEASRPPFESLSEQNPDVFNEVMDDLSTSGVKDNRFDEDWKRDFYRTYRPYTEKTFRALFIDKGGKPELIHPRYMSLGPVNWFYEWYRETKVIEIPLSAFAEEHLSFTYPDSMMSLLIAEDRYPPFQQFKQPYHGKLYRLSELEDLVATYGVPDETDPRNLEYGNRLIEAQIWDLAPLVPYIEAAS